MLLFNGINVEDEQEEPVQVLPVEDPAGKDQQGRSEDQHQEQIDDKDVEHEEVMSQEEMWDVLRRAPSSSITNSNWTIRTDDNAEDFIFPCYSGNYYSLKFGVPRASI